MLGKWDLLPALLLLLAVWHVRHPLPGSYPSASADFSFILWYEDVVLSQHIPQEYGEDQMKRWKGKCSILDTIFRLLHPLSTPSPQKCFRCLHASLLTQSYLPLRNSMKFTRRHLCLPGNSPFLPTPLITTLPPTRPCSRKSCLSFIVSPSSELLDNQCSNISFILLSLDFTQLCFQLSFGVRTVRNEEAYNIPHSWYLRVCYKARECVAIQWVRSSCQKWGPGGGESGGEEEEEEE